MNAPGAELYLTFDDGPDPEATPMVLDMLEEVGAKATFFMVGDQVRQYPQLVDEVLDRGHAIGNHTYHHVSGWQTNSDDYVEEVMSCEAQLRPHKRMAGRPLFRPPYGRITPRQALRLSKDFHVIMWSLLSGDFDRSMTPRRVLSELDTARSGDVIVFHDSAKFAPMVQEVLPEFLNRFHNKGFKFVAIHTTSR